MKKICKCGGRKKAFLGAIIGGVANIAGSAIGAAKQKKIQAEQLKQQQIEQNQNDAKAQAQALTAGVANQDYVDQYNKKVTLKMGGSSKDYKDRIKTKKKNSKMIAKCGGRKKALFGAGDAQSIASGVGDLAKSLFAPNSAPKQIKKADGFSTTGAKVDIKTPDYMQANNNNNSNNINNVNNQNNNNQFTDRINTLRCGGKKIVKRKK